MKDVLSLRPIYHRVEPRVRAHVFVATLGLLLQRCCQQRLEEAEVGLSAEQAMQAMGDGAAREFPHQRRDKNRREHRQPAHRQVMKALGITNMRPPTAPENELTVL